MVPISNKMCKNLIAMVEFGLPRHPMRYSEYSGVPLAGEKLT